MGALRPVKLTPRSVISNAGERSSQLPIRFVTCTKKPPIDGTVLLASSSPRNLASVRGQKGSGGAFGRPYTVEANCAPRETKVFSDSGGWDVRSPVGGLS